MDQEEFFISPLKGFLTMRDLATTLQVSISEVKEAITRVRLPAAKRHGVVRLWHESQVNELRQSLRK